MKYIGKNILSLLVAITILFAATGAAAKTTGIGEEFPTIMRGVRPLGMGNAFSTVPGTDLNGQFYNPAAIADYNKKKHNYEVLDPALDFDKNAFNMIGDVRSLVGDLGDASSSADKIRVFDDFTQSHAGNFNYVNIPMPLFQIRHKWYAASLILDSRTAISLRNRSFPNFEVKTKSVMGVVGGGAYGFFDDSLQVGGNLKILYGVGIEEQITTNDAVNRDLGDMLGWSAWKKGVGIGVDVGVKYTLPWGRELLRPTFSLVIQDVANTRFIGGPDALPMSITVGGGIFPEYKKFKFAVTMDFRELNQRYDFIKKFHLGFETIFPTVGHTTFSVRAGCNQGWPAVGASVNWPVVGLHFAFYGEEIGKYTRQEVNYRVITQLTFGW